MLIQPWDAAVDDAEWQAWLARTDRFGVLAVNNLDPAAAPLLVPTHFTWAGGQLLLHLARPNPVWAHLEVATEVRLAVIGDYAYIPTYWRAKAGGPDEAGARAELVSRVASQCGLVPADVRFVAPGTLPRTSSGKLRRLAVKQELEVTRG